MRIALRNRLFFNQAVEAVDEATLMGHMRNLLSGQTLIGIGSPRASVESNTALMQLVGKSFDQGISDIRYIQKRIVEVMSVSAVPAAR